MKDRSYKKEDFIKFLRICKRKAKKKLVVFLDNCKIHTSILSKQMIYKMGIEVAWGIPYNP